MPASRWLLGSAGTISGGTLAIAADAALGCALQTELGPATPYTSSELSLTLLRPVRAGSGSFSASGQLIHHGDAVGLTEAFVIEEQTERLVAHFTSRLTIFPPVSDVPQPPAEPEILDPPGDLDSDPWRGEPRGEVLSQDLWSSQSGLELLRAQIRGDLPLPPLHHLTGLEPVEAGEGEVALRLPASEWLNSPAQRLQGGVIAMLADAALVAAVQTKAGAGTAVAPLDAKVNFLRPVDGDGRDLIARAKVDHSGRTIAVADAEVTGVGGKRVALATGSSMYLPGHPADLGEIELGQSEEAGVS